MSGRTPEWSSTVEWTKKSDNKRSEHHNARAPGDIISLVFASVEILMHTTQSGLAVVLHP